MCVGYEWHRQYSYFTVNFSRLPHLPTLQTHFEKLVTSPLCNSRDKLCIWINRSKQCVQAGRLKQCKSKTQVYYRIVYYTPGGICWDSHPSNENFLQSPFGFLHPSSANIRILGGWAGLALTLIYKISISHWLRREAADGTLLRPLLRCVVSSGDGC